MEREEIKRILKDVFGKGVALVDQPEWISLPCPFAPYRHQSGADRNTSAGVNAESMVFNCYSCKTKGPLHHVIRQYADMTNRPALRLIANELEEDIYLGGDIGEWDDRETDTVTPLVPLDEAIFCDLYDSAVDHPYIASRNITKETAEMLELMYDPSDSEHEPRILFPVRGLDKRLYGFTGRAINPTARLKVRDYQGLQKRKLLLGAQFLDQADKVLLCEGLFDFARLTDAGYYAAAVLHSELTAEQAEILLEVGKPVYDFFDNDEAGRKGRMKLISLLGKHVPLLSVRYPRVQIDDDSEQGWHWLKDPGELLNEEIDTMVADAEII